MLQVVCERWCIRERTSNRVVSKRRKPVLGFLAMKEFSSSMKDFSPADLQPKQELFTWPKI